MVFPVSSTLFISRNGRVHFGHEAIKESLNDVGYGRLRFDSPKQHMSRGDFDHVIKQVVGKDINPTQFEFTKGDLITLYLSFLTDLACSELAQQGVSRYVLRRFAMPCWQMERADWADRQMKEMLAKAQILADTFSSKWAGGLDAAVVRGTLDALGQLGKLPEYLIDQGVLEAIAAASSSLPRGKGERMVRISG
jgi:molecular chaperone HscA